jgi:hypothetical protein
MGLQGISQVVLSWADVYRLICKQWNLSQCLGNARAGIFTVLACLASLTSFNLAQGQESTQIDDRLPAEATPTTTTINLDLDQKSPVLSMAREVPAPTGRYMKRAFELSAKGVLTNAPRTRMLRNVQLSPLQLQELLTSAVNAGLVELDAANLSAKISAAAAGPLADRLSKSTKAVWTIELPKGKNEVAILGYDFVKTKFPTIKAVQNLALLESKCNYLIAKDVLGDREAEVIEAVNNDAKTRKLAIRQLKPEDLRSAYELKSGRLQVTFEVKNPTPGDEAANDGQSAKVTYFVKEEGAAPMIRFFGLIKK